MQSRSRTSVEMQNESVTRVTDRKHRVLGRDLGKSNILLQLLPLS